MPKEKNNTEYSAYNYYMTFEMPYNCNNFLLNNWMYNCLLKLDLHRPLLALQDIITVFV